MLSKVQFNRQSLIVSISGIALVAIIVAGLAFGLQGQNPQTQNVTTAVESIQNIAVPEPVKMGIPLRLKIPTIKVDATVEPVGLTPQGAMGVPTGPATVAWLNLGPRPGEMGSAAIAGHYGWKDGIPAVFDNLHKLVVGDKLYVEDDQGATVTFVVRELHTYNLKEDVTNVFNSSNGQAHLNLITCQGVWNKAKQSYSNRLVIFATKE